jgi:integrase
VTWAGWRSRPPAGTLTFVQKGGAAHVIEAPRDVVASIEAWKAHEATLGRPLRSGDAMFPAVGTGGELLRASIRGLLRGLSGEAMLHIARGRFLDLGLVGPRLGFHALRATCATIAYESGATIEQVQQTLGHARLETTQGYLRRGRPGAAADSWAIDLGDRQAA